MAGDFHQHTFYTDGSDSFDFVMGKNIEFGLDWWANSEHGGQFRRNGIGRYWDDADVYARTPITRHGQASQQGARDRRAGESIGRQ